MKSGNFSLRLCVEEFRSSRSGRNLTVVLPRQFSVQRREMSHRRTVVTFAGYSEL